MGRKDLEHMFEIRSVFMSSVYFLQDLQTYWLGWREGGVLLVEVVDEE